MGVRTVVAVIGQIAGTVLVAPRVGTGDVDVVVVARCARPHAETVRLTIVVPVVSLRLVTEQHKGLTPGQVPANALVVGRVAVALRVRLVGRIVVAARP